MAGLVIADRDPGFSSAIAGEVVRRRDMPIKCAAGFIAALALVEHVSPRVVIIDVGAVVDVHSALGAVTHWATRAAVLAMAHRPAVSLAVAALKAGAQEFMEKPCDAAAVALWVLEAERPCQHVLAERLDMRLRECSSDPDIRLEMFSAQHRISTSYTSKLFRRHVGVPFRRRLTEHRVARAVELLALTDDPIWVIAEKCGFKGNSRLSVAFRKVRGQSPRRYRYLCRKADGVTLPSDIVQ